MRVVPANSGVVVTLEKRAPNEPHAIGIVLDQGGGVPWIERGRRVAYPIGEATEMRVDPTAYDGIDGAPGVFGQTDAPSYCVVYLIDQRHIHAILHN